MPSALTPWQQTRFALAQAGQFFKNYWGALLWLSAPIILLDKISLYIISRYYTIEQSTVAIIVITSLWMAWLAGAQILFIRDIAMGTPKPYSHYWRAAAAIWARLFFLRLLCGLLIGLGFVLLIVPGIIVGVRLVYAEFILVLEDRMINDSIQQSWHRSQLQFAALLFGLLVLYGVLISLAVSASYFTAAAETMNVLSLAADAVVDFLTVIPMIFLYRLFSQAAIPSSQDANGNSNGSAS
ncbi:MAG: hypothetical protein H0W44_03310 [Gammaproteobacteria bacterium]|nr:hypothetical protein [Gammaproteobacteria bacterium]